MEKNELRTYELTYLLPGALTDNEANQAKTEIEGILKKYQAKVLKTEDWGRRRLAYTIKRGGQKHVEALYVHVVLEVLPSVAQALERDVRLSAKVIRYLMIVAGEEPTTPAPQVA